MIAFDEQISFLFNCCFNDWYIINILVKVRIMYLWNMFFFPGQNLIVQDWLILVLLLN